ncbi:hypothetical protein RJ641_005807 [Dillenia turbinata]|uniref:Uncharacterized protein n=1 Tax=Dillenia turbinata TaxID=194707 RepID=A0AAN8VBV3_9MAGN
MSNISHSDQSIGASGNSAPVAELDHRVAPPPESEIVDLDRSPIPVVYLSSPEPEPSSVLDHDVDSINLDINLGNGQVQIESERGDQIDASNPDSKVAGSGSWLSIGSGTADSTNLGPSEQIDIVISALLSFGARVEEEKTKLQEERIRKANLVKARRIEKPRITKDQAARFALYSDSDDQRPSKRNKATPSAVASQTLSISSERTFAAALAEIKSGKAQQLLGWKPSRYGVLERVPSTLLELSMNVLAKNADVIVSLQGIPDILRHKLSHLVSSCRKMDAHFMGLLAAGSPAELRVKDCSRLTEEEFTEIFKHCDTQNLMVLQLDLCGGFMTDEVLHATIASSPNSLPSLVFISLKGACRFTLTGLEYLVESAPALQSVNLSQCSLLNSTAIFVLADSLRSTLRELYIENCHNIDVMDVLGRLARLEHLEVLSVSGIHTVSDDFVHEIVFAHGQHLKELFLADCLCMNDTVLLSVEGYGVGRQGSIPSTRPKDQYHCLCAQSSLCFSVTEMWDKFGSDEAVAAFLAVAGGSLRELSLNKVCKVGLNTALSISKFSRKLLRLDLSWCRKMTDEDLGLIVDSCKSLKLLKVFGCAQISDAFPSGHSNSLVRVIGLNMKPFLDHMNLDLHGEA